MDKEIVYYSCNYCLSKALKVNSREYEIKITPRQIGEFPDGQQEFNSNYNQQRNNLKS